MLSAQEKEGKTRELVLQGALVIQRVTEVKDELKKALDEVDTLMVNFTETSEVDLSCLQLLCSAHRTAVGLNKTLLRVGGAPAGMNGLMSGAGLLGFSGCSVACSHGCIWDDGEAMAIKKSEGEEGI